MLSEYRINVCSLSLGISSVLLLEISQGCKDLASGNGNNRDVPMILRGKKRNIKLHVSPVTAGCE